MNDLLKTLYLVRALSANPMSSQELQDLLRLSLPTLNRHLASARDLGAVITARQTNRQWRYHLDNPDAVQNTLTTWIRLEEERDLTADDFARPYKR